LIRKEKERLKTSELAIVCLLKDHHLRLANVPHFKLVQGVSRVATPEDGTGRSWS